MSMGNMAKYLLGSVVFSLMVWMLESAAVEGGKVLGPIYWNTSNTLFRSQNEYEADIKVDIDDKLDIICPRQGRDGDDDHLFFKLYLVDEKNYTECNTVGGRRLLTCDVPHKEKKYTFYFQEISPSPWGLEFDPNKSYYLISTSDGSRAGINLKKGGACTQFNMKLKLMVRDKPGERSTSSYRVSTSTISTLRTIFSSSKQPSRGPHMSGPKTVSPDDVAVAETPVHVTTDEDAIMNNGIVVGIILGACAVLFFVFLAFLGYKIYRRKRYLKKYPSPPTTRGSTPLQHVDILPTSHLPHPALRHSMRRLLSDPDCSNRTDTISSHREFRPPPSYNESFLENGGPVVAV